jgi:hypothetical protein
MLLSSNLSRLIVSQRSRINFEEFEICAAQNNPLVKNPRNIALLADRVMVQNDTAFTTMAPQTQSVSNN